MAFVAMRAGLPRDRTCFESCGFEASNEHKGIGTLMPCGAEWGFGTSVDSMSPSGTGSSSAGKIDFSASVIAADAPRRICSLRSRTHLEGVENESNMESDDSCLR